MKSLLWSWQRSCNGHLALPSCIVWQCRFVCTFATNVFIQLSTHLVNTRWQKCLDRTVTCLIAQGGQVQLLLGCSLHDGDGVVHIGVGLAPAHHHRLAGLTGAYQGGVVSLPKLVCESPEDETCCILHDFHSMVHGTHGSGRHTGKAETLYTTGLISLSSMISLMASPLSVLEYWGWGIERSTGISCSRDKHCLWKPLYVETISPGGVEHK